MTVVHAPFTSSVTDTAEVLKELSPLAGERKYKLPYCKRETMSVSRLSRIWQETNNQLKNKHKKSKWKISHLIKEKKVKYQASFYDKTMNRAEDRTLWIDGRGFDSTSPIKRGVQKGLTICWQTYATSVDALCRLALTEWWSEIGSLYPVLKADIEKLEEKYDIWHSGLFILHFSFSVHLL